MSKIQTLRGMNDLNPQEAKEWSYVEGIIKSIVESYGYCLLYTSPSPRDVEESRIPSCA